MRIDNLRVREMADGRVRASCDIALEQSQQRFEDLYVEVEQADAEGFHASPEGFVIASYVAARHLGEHRILIDDALCAELAAALPKLGMVHDAWFGTVDPPVRIESTQGIVPKPQNTAPAACAFLSGGADSFSMLFDNILRYPAGDPRAISQALCVYGLDVGDPNKAPRPDIFTETIARLTRTLASRGRGLIPVHTNLRTLCPDWQVYEKQQFASLLAAIAHFFSGRFSRTTIGLDLTIAEYVDNAYGSHPWPNQYLSSSQLRFDSQMEHLARLDKLRLLADWPEIGDALRVCFNLQDIPEGQVNCGRCAKCTFTKLEMLVAGTLADSTCFPSPEVDIQALRELRFNYTGFWQQLVPALRDTGHDELADIIQDKLDHNDTIWADMAVKPSLARRALNRLRRLARG